MASIEQRKNNDGSIVYRVQIRKKGIPDIRKSFSSKEEAEQYCKSVEDSIDGKLEIPKFPLFLWIERYKKEILPTKNFANKQIIFLDFWGKYLGNEIACEINPLKIELLANGLLEKKSRLGGNMSLETRRKYLVALSSIYTCAIKQWKWAFHNPVSMIPDRQKEIAQKRKERQEQVKEVKNLSKNIERVKNEIIYYCREYMKNNNISETKLGYKSGMQKSGIQRILNPSFNSSLESLLKICSFLGLEISISKTDSATQVQHNQK